MTVLTISQDTLIQLPDGASGGSVTVTYHGTTTGPVIGSGDDQGRAVIVSGRLAKLTNVGKNAPLKVIGREAGGRMPARVTLRVYPEYPAGKSGPVAPITLSGLPVGSPDAPGIWDLSNIDDASGGLDVVTAGERQSLAVLRERAAAAADRVEAGAGQVGQTLAQVSQQQQDNNAQAAMNIGRRTALQVGLIGAAVGLYNITAGPDAGQVWERPSASAAPERRAGLEAASLPQLQEVEGLTTLLRESAPRQAGGVVGVVEGQQTGATLAGALATTAVDLTAGRFGIGGAGPVILNQRPLRGLGAGRTILKSSGASPAVIINPAPGAFAFVRPSGTVLEDLEVRGYEDPALAADPHRDGNTTTQPPPGTGYDVGILHNGSRRATRRVAVSGFYNGYLFGTQDTYINRVEDLHTYYNVFGIVFPPPTGNSGENMVIDGGVAHNNRYNVRLDSRAWFATLQNYSLDYPDYAQFYVTDTLFAFRMLGGHIEHHLPQVLVDAPVPALGAPKLDAGIVRFENVNLALFTGVPQESDDPNANTFRKRFMEQDIDQLVSPNVGAVTLVFKNCTDAVYGEQVNRVMTRGRGTVPGAAGITPGVWYDNATLVPMDVRLDVQASGAANVARAVEVFVRDKSGTGERSVSRQVVAEGTPSGGVLVLRFRVEASEQWRVALSNMTIEASAAALIP